MTNQQEVYISVLAIYKLGGLGTSQARNLPHQCTNWRIGYLFWLDLRATKAKLPIKQIATKAASAEAKQFLSALLTRGKTLALETTIMPETRGNPSIWTWHQHGYLAWWRFEPLSNSGSLANSQWKGVGSCWIHRTTEAATLSPCFVSRLLGPVNQKMVWVWSHLQCSHWGSFLLGSRL